MSTPSGFNKEMTDIHMHLIPGVDDGAEDLQMAMTMLYRARQQGITQIVATPHSDAFLHSEDSIKDLFRKLTDAAAQTYPDMRLYLGCEVYCEESRMATVQIALRAGIFPTMNGSKYVLMEFSQWVRPERTLPCVKTLIHDGYLPIIAHMERYTHLRGQMALVNRFRELGALIQVNAYSLSDEMDDSIRNWAQQLVLERKVDFLGTDAHRTYHRPPCAERGLSWLYENVEPDYADAIARDNARRLFL